MYKKKLGHISRIKMDNFTGNFNNIIFLGNTQKACVHNDSIKLDCVDNCIGMEIIGYSRSNNVNYAHYMIYSLDGEYISDRDRYLCIRDYMREYREFHGMVYRLDELE